MQRIVAIIAIFKIIKISAIFAMITIVTLVIIVAVVTKPAIAAVVITDLIADLDERFVAKIAVENNRLPVLVDFGGAEKH